MKNTRALFVTITFILALLFSYSYQLSAANSFRHWLFSGFGFFTSSPSPTPTPEEGNAIQIALLLDTSNSMDGLIEQAKSQLWKIVNELNEAEHKNETPNLEIALYEYGNDGLSKRSGFIRQVTPFTNDMDLVSDRLFNLSTNGGDEYCGQVIVTSLHELEWSAKTEDLKLIYIAGNENFNQGSTSYTLACKQAKNSDVIVNTIYCGSRSAGINTFWKDGADLAGGNYTSIDHNRATRYIDTPYDDEISTLNDQLNNTYIPYGNDGAKYRSNQILQDSNADKYSKANKVDRAVFKSSKNYKNSKWDFVDAYKKDKKVIQKKSKLPETYKGKSEAEIEALVEQKLQERKAIKDKIHTLSKQRKGYIKTEKEKLKETAADNLDESIISTVKKQAKQKGYKFKN